MSLPPPSPAQGLLLIDMLAGPGLVNLGKALVTGSGIITTSAWVGSLALGGLLVSAFNFVVHVHTYLSCLSGSFWVLPP